MENIRIYTATYNVGTANPDQPLEEFLASYCKEDKLPDFYVLSFQEVKAQPQNMLLDVLFDDPWSHECRRLLQARNYIKLKSIRLQGLVMVVFSLRKHLLNIREIESEYTRTGFSGMWGNKGAVSIRLSIYGCSLCFVNAHLSAHDENLKDRCEDYNNIIKDQEFHVQETSKILFHDYVFWMGDLNFRLMEDYDKSPEEIEHQIIKKEIRQLFAHDQLRYVMRKGEAFSELTEQDPEFPPTFKFDVGTNKYDYKRRPAWCDRILYRVNSNNYENVTLKVDQLSYKSHRNYVLSDHKPVTAEFIIKIPPINLGPTVDQVFSGFSEEVVKFDHINEWNIDEDHKVVFRLNREMPETKDDWIGVFRENFSALDEYVSYDYVNKCSTPIKDKQFTFPNGKPNAFEVNITEFSSHSSGNYCLVYFSNSEDKVTSVLGISNPFRVVKRKHD